MRVKVMEGGREGGDGTYLEVAMDDVEGVHVLDPAQDLEAGREGGREGQNESASWGITKMREGEREGGSGGIPGKQRTGRGRG